MELLFLDEKFGLISAPVDRYHSLQWEENYYDEGKFELHLAPDYISTVLAAEYIYNNEADEAMQIIDVRADDDGKQSLQISGVSLESLLKLRVMDEAKTYTGTVEEIARQAVTDFAITGDKAIPLLELGELNGYTDTAIATNQVGAELYEWLRELLKPYEMSFRIHYDYEQSRMTFTVYRGLDRTQEQDTNTWAIFSTSFENLSQFSYARNRKDYRNYAIVMTDSGTRVDVDQTNGEPRRELFVSTSDDLDTEAMTQLGVSALAEYAMVETIGGEVQGNANLVYGTNYALGDRCNIEDSDLGVSASARLTQMMTVVENGATRRIPAFGEQYLSLRQYIAREVGKSGTSGGGGSAPVVDLTEVWAAISANADAINANAADIEAAQAAIYDNARAITALDGRVTTLEENTSGLPSGYTALNYLTFNNAPYIDTGFKPTQNTRIVIDFELLNAVAAGLFGSRDGDKNNAYNIFAYSTNNAFRDDYYNSQQSSIPSAIGRYIIDKDKNITTLTGVTNSNLKDTITHTKSTFSGNYNMFIGAVNSVGTAIYIASIKLYTAKIYNDGVLIRDFVPCIDRSGEYGLFDKIYKLFYGNAGTGSFTGG
jgi:hypothetical protein